MRRIKLPNPDRDGHYTLSKVDNFEYANPIEKMAEITIATTADMYRDFVTLSTQNNPALQALALQLDNPEKTIARLSIKNGIETWNELYQEIMGRTLPEKLFDILENASKKDQVKILKGMALSGDDLMFFIFKAWINYNFTYSTYSFEHAQTGLDIKEMPLFAYTDGEKLKTVGKTNLTEGQIKQAIEHRQYLVSKFLDKGEKWHCFFLTFKSIRGGEKAWKNGKPHLHFISHTWGYTREHVLKQLQSKKYKLGSLPHIDYIIDRD